MGVPNRERRNNPEQRDRQNLRPSGQLLPLERKENQIYLQLPEGRGEAILTPTSTYTIAACRNK